jgi:UDP-N-acetylmuramate--alanine ligase
LPENSLLVINKNIDDINYFVKDSNIEFLTYGDDDNSDFYFKNVSYDEFHYQSFDVYNKDKFIGRMRQRLIGRHNALNFLSAMIILLKMGITFEEIKNSLEDFKGARRRLEIIKIDKGITYIDDYAHHPTEIEASLNALKEIKYNKLYLIFQPHTFTRTKAFYNDFVRVLGNTEIVIMAKIYPAREKDLGIISSKDIKDGIIKDKMNENNFCEYFENFEEISKYIDENAKSGDLVVTMGAGDVYKLHNLFKH